MLVSNMVAHLYLDVLIIKLFYLTDGSIATELVEARRVQPVESSLHTTQIARTVEGHLVIGVIVIGRLHFIANLFALAPLDTTNSGLSHIAPFTIFVVDLVSYCSVFHHTHIVGEVWVNGN